MFIVKPVWRGRSSCLFSKVDRWGAGNVTADQIMSNLDANGDGKFDLDEAPDDLTGAFGMVDANADGGID